jgi:diacylglycerol kinase (ATP)
MRKALLLYNPSSGSRQERRRCEIEAVLALLREAGITVTADVTGSAEGATQKARDAVASGCDTVFACGGDGTVHDVLQGLAGSQVALAVIPLGTANALAHDLGIPRKPLAAARVALTSQPRRIALGRISYLDFDGNPVARFFTVAAGIGVDAHMFYKLNRAMKQRLGMVAYYAQATALWLAHKMQFFDVTFHSRTGEERRASVSELLAVRITEFGGVLRQLAPGASLREPDFMLVLFKTKSRLRFLAYILRGLFGTRWKVPGVDLVPADRVSCSGAAPSTSEAALDQKTTKIYVEADGELVGTLPAQITVVPDALTILVPTSRAG